MAAAPICISCNLERILVSTTPAKNRHDMLHYECPACRTVFRLVMERPALELEDLVFDEPALRASSR